MSPIHRISSQFFKLALVTALSALAPSIAFAQNGNGKGGGGSTPPPAYSIVELPSLTLRGYKVTNPDAAGFVTIVGEGDENGYVTAALARVRISDRGVTSFFLPEPTDNSPLGDVGSNAYDVNLAQTVVGGVVMHTLEENGAYLPARWFPANTPSGFAYQLLPLLAGHENGEARGVNESGWMVGRLDADIDTSTAVLWSPDGADVYDLNDALPEDSGWYLSEGFKINDSDQVIGSGWFLGIETGYRMNLAFGIDPVTGELLIAGNIEAIPLVPVADRTTVYAVSKAGEVLAGQRVPSDPPQYRVHGSIWRGTGTLSELLPSAVDGPAIGRGINALGSIVGDSTVLGIDLINGDAFRATLFRPRTGGGYQAVDLNALIPAKPAWYLRYAFGINDQGWIVAYGRKFVKGVYTWRTVLLVPNS